MPRIIAAFVLILFGLFQPVVAQTLITQWDFNGSSAATVPGGPSSPTSSTGTGSLVLIGGATGAFNSGLVSSDPVATNPPNFSWETSGYPAPMTAEKTAGIQINVSTVGFNSISLVFDHRLSNTSANTWVVFYTADVTAGSPTWVEFQTFTFTPAPSGTGDTWYNLRIVDFSALAELVDNPNVSFKIVSAFDPVALDYKASRSTSTYATSGKARFDMVTVYGVPLVIIQNDPPTASAVNETGILGIGDTLRAKYTYADAEGDDQGGSIYKWYSATDANGSNEVQIGGVDTLIYVITANDLNKFISFEVTPVAQTGGSPGTPVKAPYAGPVLDLGDPSVIKINEVYTRGIDTNPNPDLHADWVEFYNPGPKDVTLAGLRICDSGTCEVFPVSAYAQLVVPSGGFLALSEDQANSFTFGLSSLGEFVALRHLDNSLIDSLSFPALEDTQSFGKFPNGAPDAFKLVPPTKAASNTTATQTFGDQSLIRINEVYNQGLGSHSNPALKSDWIEFYNPGPEQVWLKGLTLCNGIDCITLSYGSPAVFMIPAGGFYTVSDTSSFFLELSPAGEQVSLRLSGTTIDSLIVPAMAEAQSFGRLQDGTVFVTLLEPPTPNMSNNTATAIEITGLEFELIHMRLYPNPASSTLTIEAGANEVIRHVSLFSVTGQEVVSQSSGGSSTQVSVSGLSSGFYIVRATMGSGKSEIRKLFKD